MNSRMPPSTKWIGAPCRWRCRVATARRSSRAPDGSRVVGAAVGAGDDEIDGASSDRFAHGARRFGPRLATAPADARAILAALAAPRDDGADARAALLGVVLALDQHHGR